MEIRRLEEKDRQAYDALALSVGSVFDTTGWTRAFGSGITHYAICERGGAMVGGFCTYRTSVLGMSVLRNPPFTPSIGPFLKTCGGATSRLDAWKEAIGAMAAHVGEMGFSLISFSLSREVVDTQPYIWNKFKVTPGYTYVLDLQRAYEELWADVSKKHRHDINKAAKDGLEVRQVPDPSIVRALVLKTFGRQGKKIDSGPLDAVLSGFATPENSFSFATFAGDTPIAGTFFLHDRTTCYALLGGYDHERRHHGAGALTDWEGLRHAQRLGLKYFDFEGSMVPAIERYFRGFGGRLTPYYRVHKARLPIEVVLKFYKREIF